MYCLFSNFYSNTSLFYNSATSNRFLYDFKALGESMLKEWDMIGSEFKIPTQRRRIHRRTSRKMELFYFIIPRMINFSLEVVLCCRNEVWLLSWLEGLQNKACKTALSWDPSQPGFLLSRGCEKMYYEGIMCHISPVHYQSKTGDMKLIMTWTIMWFNC
jgi:hypothetical protein